MTAVSTKAQKGIGMEGALARWYAGNTRKSLGEFQALARRIAGEIAPGSSVLEVAPGPGFFAVELARLGDYHVTGLDISQTFVEMARRNAAEAQVDVDFRQGNASAMPFENDGSIFSLPGGVQEFRRTGGRTSRNAPRAQAWRAGLSSSTCCGTRR